MEARAGGAPASPPSPPAPALSAAQRARAERQRLRARELHAARLLRAPPAAAAPAPPSAPQDSGGGFLLPAAAPAPPAPPRQRPAPRVHVSEQPHCVDCGRPFAQSYLHDTFDCSVCDDCRDAEGAHALLPRTEAKREFLLQDCDLDLRPPPLRCETRRNPHRGGADMRLYLRAQLELRAAQVWGSAAALEAERERRAARAERARAAAAERRVRALRMDVRSSLFARARAAAPHAHRWGAERPAAGDEFSRTCLDCGLSETYEKM